MRIVFRADASFRIGSGHVMRCLTLADALRERGADCLFLSRAHEGHLLDTIRARGHHAVALGLLPRTPPPCGRGDYHLWLGATQAQDAEACAARIETPADWLVVDHYGLDAQWEDLMRPKARRILALDDLADRDHSADMLLDQNHYRDQETRYEGRILPTCTRLLGPAHALLRPEFARARSATRSGPIQRVLVFFGAADARNLAGLALEALHGPELSNLEVEAVASPSSPHYPALQALAAARPRTLLHGHVPDMAALMARADLALGAGGTATWERLCVGLPALVVTLADNQVRLARDLAEEGWIRLLGPAQEMNVESFRRSLREALADPEALRAQAREGGRRVDGLGAGRVAEILARGVPPEDWEVRAARPEDSRLYWHWANDPDVRRQAFNADPIPWETHQAWFARRIADTDTTLLVVDSPQGPVGQVRFEREGAEAVIDYAIARQFRGLGLGQALMARAMEAYAQGSGAGLPLVGEVKLGNPASAKVFLALGFEEVLERARDGVRCFVYHRDQPASKKVRSVHA